MGSLATDAEGPWTGRCAGRRSACARPGTGLLGKTTSPEYG